MQNTYLGEAGFFFPQIYCGSVIGEELFFPSYNINGIYSLKLYSGIITFRCFFEGEDYLSKYLFSECIGFENKVFFVPDMGKSVDYYNAIDNLVKPAKNRFKNEISHNIYSKIIQNDIYFFGAPVSGGKIIKVNMKEGEIEKIYDVEKKYFQMFGKHFRSFTDSGLYIFDNVIYGAFMEEPIIFKLDMRTEAIDFIVLSELQEGFIQMEGDEDKLILLNIEKKLIIFDISRETISETIVLDLEIEPIKFRMHYKDGKNICFCSYEDSQIFHINTDTKKYGMHMAEEDYEINKERGEKYKCIHEGNGEYAIFISNKGNLIWKNLMNGQSRCVKLIYAPDPTIITKYKNAGGMCLAEDGELMCIENLIKYCEGNDYGMKEGNVGVEIFKKTCD